MLPLPRMQSFKANLFWRHFASYFVLILIPVMAASVLTHVLVVRMIEEDARKLSDMVMSRFTEQANTEIQSLRTSMINMLSTSNIRTVLKEAGHPYPDGSRRSEMIQSLREQLVKLQSSELVSKAYLVFANHDLIIDGDMYTNKGYYFNIRQPLDTREQAFFTADLSGKKMMSFAEPQGSDIPVLMSYPFNTASPEVYLVVNLSQNKLQQLIHVKQDWVAGTAIVGSDGRVLSRSGAMTELDLASLPLQSDNRNASFNVAENKAVSLVPSRFDEAWSYLSIIDMKTLMKPADVTRLVSWGFLFFFVLIGSIVSYHLSRRIYTPVMEIKEGLKTRNPEEERLHAGGNDFDVIKRYSRLIVSENEQLSQLVSGMTPIVHEHFIAKILQGQYRDALSIETYAREINFPYSRKAARTVLCVALHYEVEYEQLSESSKSFLMAELKERIRGLVPASMWLSQTKPDTLACVIHQDPFLQLRPEEEADLVKLALQLYANYFKATIGIGSTVQTVEELHLSYEHAVSLLQRRRLHSGVEICSASTSPESARFDSFLTVQDVNRMLNQCKTREYDKVLQSAYHILEEGVALNATAVQVKQLCSDILNTWIRAAEDDRKDFNVPFYAGLFDKLNRCMTIDEVKNHFRDTHTLLFPPPEAAEDAGPGKFSGILDYIHEHYDQELSIEHFAASLNMSVGHFSRTFKEEVGEKYVEYIARYRLMKAKEMLLQTDLKIDDIAEKVGYWGRNSFIRVFRKYEGITPAKYRTLHQ